MRSPKIAPRRTLVLLLSLLVIAICLLWWRGHNPSAGTEASSSSSPRPSSISAHPWELSQSTSQHGRSATPHASFAPSPSSAIAPTPPVSATSPAAPPRPPVSWRLPTEVQRGTPVASTTSPSSPQGERRRTTVHRTNFKYPLLRTEELFTIAADGSEVLLKRRTMVADHFRIRLRNGFTETQLQAWLATQQLSIRRHIPNTPFYLVAMPSADIAAYDAALQHLGQLKGQNAPIAYAEPDYIVQTSQVDAPPADDPRFAEQWNLHNTGQNGGTPSADINVLPAWSITTGSNNVIVAMLDSGVDIDHPDLVDNLWVNPGEAGGVAGVDDDNNGYVDDINGVNFSVLETHPDRSVPEDGNGHGTHTAGTVGAVGNNQVGLSGVAQKVKIMALKFLSDEGSGSDSDAIEALAYATANGAMLTSNSWGGGDESAAMQEIINLAADANVGCIIAAGNDGTNNDIIPVYPASYNSPNIIVVAATDADDDMAWFSCYGKTWVHLGAPGVDVLSTIPGGYGYNSGTSMAAPHVSGVAALMRAANPTMSFAAIKAAMLAQARPIPGLAGKTVTGGVVDAGSSLPLAIAPYPILLGSSIDDSGDSGTQGNDDGILSPGETVALTLNLQNLGGHPTGIVQGQLAMQSLDAQVSLASSTASFGTLAAGANAQNTTPFVLSIDPAHPTPANLPFTLTLTDDANRTWTLDLTLHLYTTSLVSGKVTRLDGNTPIANATIHLNGTIPVSTTTNANGEYSATVVDGNYAVTASATGYITSTAQNIHAPPAVANLNFSLGYSSLVVSPLQLSATLQEDTTTTQPITLTNNGDQDLSWRFLELTSSSAPSTTQQQPPPPVLTSRSSHLAKHLTSSQPAKPHTIQEGPSGRLRLPSGPRGLDNDTATISSLPFADGFEDGTYNRWYESFSEAVREVVTEPDAPVGDHSFHFRLEGEDDHLTGVHQEFEWGAQPGYVSFRIRTSARDSASGYVVLGDVSGNYLDDFIWFFANANGRFYINDDVGGNQLVAYKANQWYHIEFRNINWTSKTFDYAVDGVVKQTGIPFRNAEYVDECAYAFIYNYQHDVDTWWDEFIFSSDALDWLTIAPNSGSTAPNGGASNLIANFDANDLLAGSYHGTLRLLTNDPLQPETHLPVEMTVTPAPNEPPIAHSSTVDAVEDTNATASLSGSDPDGNTLTYRITQLPAHGQLYQTTGSNVPTVPITQVPTTVTSSGHQVVYVPLPNSSGLSYGDFQFIAHDGRAASAPATVTVNVEARPDSPAARADAYSVLPGQGIAAMSVLDNDYSADLKTFNITGFSQPTDSKGIVTSNGNNTLAFSPSVYFVSGSTSFTYTISDGTLSRSAIVTLHLGPLSDNAWPTYGGNAYRTHYHPASTTGSQPLQLLWQHSFAQTPNPPVIGAGRAFFTTHADEEDEHVIALNLMSGDAAWTLSEPASEAINTPVWNSTRLYLSRSNSYDNSYITTIDSNTGALFSSYTFPGIPSEIGKHLLFANQRIYLPGGPGAKLYSVEPGSSYAPFIATLPFNQTATPTYADHLVLLATFGTVRALNPATGIVHWTFKPDSTLSEGTGEIAWQAGKAFIILGGKLHAIRTLQEPSLAWSSGDAGHQFSPVIAGKRVYAVHQSNEVRAYDITTGTVAATYPLAESVAYQPAVCQDTLVLPTTTGTQLIRLSDGVAADSLPATGHLAIAGRVLLITNPATKQAAAYGLEPLVTINPNGGTFLQPLFVHVGCVDPDAAVHYTIDGSQPTASSPVLLPSQPQYYLRSTQLRAMAILGTRQGPVKTANFTITDANGNGFPDWWEIQYGATRPGSPTVLSPGIDYDHDGLSDLDEFILGTNPNTSDQLQPTVIRSPAGVTSLTWPSQLGRYYTLLSSNTLQPNDWQPESTAKNLSGTGSTMTWQDPAAPPAFKFYRLSVSLPPAAEASD